MSTPAFGAVGAYTVKSPFTLPTGATYICNGIDSFESLEKRSIDVYATYYEPQSISEDIYNTDKANAENIVTLYSQENDTIFIPSSYIESFPTSLGVSYRELYLVFAIGGLPDSIDVTTELAQIKEIVDADLGVTSTTQLVSSPLSTVVDYATYQTNEQARLANIDYKASLAKQLAESQAMASSLQTKVTTLQALVISLQSS